MTFSFSSVNLYPYVTIHYIKYLLTVNLLGKTKAKKKELNALPYLMSPAMLVSFLLLPSYSLFLMPFTSLPS